ncbi:MAG: hypothetical protein ACYSWP_21085, partial [Planctomycetota bacterium]
AGDTWPQYRHWPFPDRIGSIGTGAEWRKYSGLSAAELFKSRFAQFNPEYFVITNMGDFDKQKSLKELLFGNFRILVQNDKYLIFDLTTPLE